MAGISVPSFVLAPIMQYWIGFKWGLLPIAFFDSWVHLIMPRWPSPSSWWPSWPGYVRAEMLEVLGQDYVTLAKAKGSHPHGGGRQARAAELAHTAGHVLLPLVVGS